MTVTALTAVTVTAVTVIGHGCCRATARVTTGQRKILDQVEQVQQKQAEDGSTYWTYDHISQVQRDNLLGSINCRRGPAAF